MIRLLAAVALLALAGCVSIPQGSECGMWDAIPYDGSQELWRQFDCPLTGQRSMFHKIQE